MTIQELKNEMIETLATIDKGKLHLVDMKLYADVLKTVSEIQAKSYAEALADVMASPNGFAGGFKQPTISEMKGE